MTKYENIHLTPSQVLKLQDRVREIEGKIITLEIEDEEANAGKIERLVDRKDALDLALSSYLSGSCNTIEARTLINNL